MNNSLCRSFPRLLVFLLLIFSLLLFRNIVSAQDNSEPIQLREITVTPGKFTIREGTQSTLSLSKKEIDLFPLIDNDIARAAQVFPGVVSNDFSARFNVRGGEKDEILVRLDGMELFEPYHLQDFGGAISIIDLGLVRRADLLMGGFPAEYGDKMSGVFDITAKEGSREGFGMNFGIDLINAHTLLEGPLSEKGSWLLSARRGYVDLILALIDADEELKPQYADLYGKIAYDFTDRDKLTLNGLYAWDKNLIDEDDDENDLRSTYQNAIIWTKWRHFFSERIWSDLFVFNGIATRDRQKGSGLDERELGFIGAKGEVTAQILKTHTIRGGVEWRWSTAEYDYDIRERRAGIDQYDRITAKVDDSGNEVKAYLQDEWQIHPMLAVNVGGRYLIQDYRRSGVQKYEVSPRIALAVKPIENLVLRGAWGLYHQPIELLTIPVEDEIDSVGRAEEATHYVIGAEYALRGNFLIRAEGYYKTLENLAGQIRDFGRQTQIFTNPDSGNVKGFDLLMSRAVSDQLTWSLGYAYAIAKEQSGDEEFFREFDQRHTIALNGSYQLSQGWHLHTTWRFHTGNPTTELTHTIVTLPDGNLTCDRQLGSTNSQRLPPYHSLDLRFTKTSFHRSWNLTWYVQVLNLYNRSNVHERAFSQIRDEDTNAIIGCDVSDEPLFPIVPTLGISATF
ncbi:TonB-dependent receptor [Candidatus Poribacteria bacterium]|nr:TonB-dependent receptor [Candidatus Poribacteria bacterium]